MSCVPFFSSSEYDSFGKILLETNPAAGDRFKFTGREYDAETGIDYYRARYYDPSSGRFISQYPFGFAGHDANLYRYVGNSPLNATDPSGNIAIVKYLIGAGIGGAVGAITGYATGFWCAYWNEWLIRSTRDVLHPSPFVDMEDLNWDRIHADGVKGSEVRWSNRSLGRWCHSGIDGGASSYLDCSARCVCRWCGWYLVAVATKRNG